MLTQTLPSTAFTIVAPQVKHLVTLRHPVTEDEQFFEVVTATNRFTDVLRQIQWQRAEAGLFGYQVYETLEVDPKF